jgi:hypothetical protein
MGVLDVTDWFTKNPSPGDAALINGLYPWEFLQEVRAKIGSVEFFSSTLNEDSPELKDIIKKIADGTWTEEDCVPRGTLLPFAFDSTASLLGNGNYIPHPTLSKWVLNRDGTVHIPEVALLTFDRHSDEYNEDCEIHGPSMEEWGKIVKEKVDLFIWKMDYARKMPNYAVCTHFNDETVFGVLLKEVNPGQFVKVGNFESTWYPEMGYEIVDWTVL